MKKIFLVLFLSLICQLFIVNYAYSGWPFNRTAAIEGQVTDATTGKPLENVVVGCEWVKAHHSLGGDIRKGFSYEVSVTDKEGKYRIPGKTSFHIFSKFSNREISFSHPLYETKRFSGGQSKDERGDYISVPIPEEDNYSNYIYEKDGIIHFDLKLLSLEEKYVRGFKIKGKYEGSFTSFLEGMTGKGFMSIKKKFGVRLDIDYMLDKWIGIAQEISPLGSNQEPYLWKQIERLKKEFSQIKAEGY